MRTLLSVLLLFSATAHAASGFDGALKRQVKLIPGMVVKDLAKQGTKISRTDVKLGKLQVGNGTIAIPFSSGTPNKKIGYFRGKALITTSEYGAFQHPRYVSVRHDASVTTKAELAKTLRANRYAFDTY